MPWQTPKTNWAVGDGVSNSDFNRIEGNTQESYNKTGNIGEIKFVARATLMQNELKANGASLSTALYPELFAEIGYTFGGSGGTFNLPDLRGEFLRGWDDGRGIDVARLIGSTQGDAIRNITGYFGRMDAEVDLLSGAFYHYGSVGYDANSTMGGGGRYVGFDASRVVPTASENRPRNIALMAVIIYK